MKSHVGKPARGAKAPRLRNPVEIEDIESMRCRAGIDDVELRDEIRLLRAGDTVNLTFLKDAASPRGETLAVRITSVRGSAFRGTLAARPASALRAALRPSGTITFRTEHIHSIHGKRGCDG